MREPIYPFQQQEAVMMKTGGSGEIVRSPAKSKRRFTLVTHESLLAERRKQEKWPTAAGHRNLSLPRIGDRAPWKKEFDELAERIMFLCTQEIGDCFTKKENTFGVDEDYRQFHGEIRTVYVRKEKRVGGWRFWRKTTVRRNVIRLTNGNIYRNRPNDAVMIGIKNNEHDGIRCEFFLADPRLRDIAQRVLEPLATAYFPIKYIDAYNEDEAFYPGERPELPKARLLNV